MAYDTLYDVIVCGGGTSGVAAAIASARAGAKTLLVERTGTLGGQMNLSGPPGFAYARLFNPQGKRDVGGIVEETYQRLFKTGHKSRKEVQTSRACTSLSRFAFLVFF